MQQPRERVITSGPYTGERPYVPYFWKEQAHRRKCIKPRMFVWEITPEDRAKFPELKGQRKVVLVKPYGSTVEEW